MQFAFNPLFVIPFTICRASCPVFWSLPFTFSLPLPFCHESLSFALCALPFFVLLYFTFGPSVSFFLVFHPTLHFAMTSSHTSSSLRYLHLIRLRSFCRALCFILFLCLAFRPFPSPSRTCPMPCHLSCPLTSLFPASFLTPLPFDLTVSPCHFALLSCSFFVTHLSNQLLFAVTFALAVPLSLSSCLPVHPYLSPC